MRKTFRTAPSPKLSTPRARVLGLQLSASFDQGATLLFHAIVGDDANDVDRAGAYTEFDRAICRQIVTLFDDNRNLTIGLVLAALKGRFPRNDLQIRTHIARLLKYDVLRLGVILPAELKISENDRNGDVLQE